MKFSFKTSIGGLEVSDTALRFVMVRTNKTVVSQAVVSLSPNIIQGGRVVNERALIVALRDLQKQIGGGEIPVILTLPPALVYAQVFTLPLTEERAEEEAARLNLRVISPIEFDSAYADWQVVGEAPQSAGTQIEALGAFVESAVVDAYTRALHEAGFFVVAVEFSSLSLSRVIHETSELDQETPYCVFSVTSDGVTFLILRNGSPYFTRFMPWSAFGETPVGVLHFRSVIGGELRRLFNFYSSRWGDSIKKALVINTTSNKEIAEWIKNEFSLEVFSLSGYHTIDRTWLTALGAAMRGLTPRAEDRSISLAKVGTEDAFIRTRIERFIAVWRNVVFAAMGIILLSYLGIDLFLIRIKNNVEQQVVGVRSTNDMQELAFLQSQAENFNALVDKVVTAESQARPFSSLIRAIYRVAGSTITLEELQFDVKTSTIVVNGTAPNEQAVIAFKNALAANNEIAEILLPLSAIISLPNGQAAFRAAITVK